MKRLTFLPVAILMASLLSTASFCTEPAPETSAESAPAGLLGETYPLAAPVSFPAALLHWLDSVTYLRGAGMTAGKTIEAHRQAYIDFLGVPAEEEQQLLEAYRSVRVGFASGASGNRDDLTRAFFEAETIDEALEQAKPLLSERDLTRLSESVRHFEPGYRRIWNDGKTVRAFLNRAESSKQGDKLAEFLAGVAKFYGVDPDMEPRPRLVLVPVPAGAGTHAQAIEEFLLVEVRPGDGLRDQVAPIVHENAHLLFRRMGQERIKALEAAAVAHGPMGQANWLHLNEALPTAIGQGVAQVNFRIEGWSLQMRWYDVEVVDVFAKKIFPKVKRALSTGRPLDPALIEEFVEIYKSSVAPRTAGAAATPR